MSIKERFQTFYKELWKKIREKRLEDFPPLLPNLPYPYNYVCVWRGCMYDCIYTTKKLTFISGPILAFKNDSDALRINWFHYTQRAWCLTQGQPSNKWEDHINSFNNLIFNYEYYKLRWYN